MNQTNVALDDRFLSFISKRKIELPRKLTELSVLELYRRKEISSGKAGELLGMERFEFIKYASRLGIAFFDVSGEELERDIQSARKIADKIK